MCLLLFELLGRGGVVHLFCMHVHLIFIEYIGHFAAQVLCIDPNACFLLERFTCIGPVNIGMQRGLALRSLSYQARSMAGQETDLLELQ